METIQQLKNRLHDIVGSWNGDDKVGEERMEKAQEALDLISRVEELVKEL